MIELAKQFVPATDEVWRLQRGDDPECLFFQDMANNGHYGKMPGHSRQGIYVFSPSGKFLASINSNDPNRVLAMMKRGRENWESLAANDKSLADDSKIKPRHRWEDSYPKDGLVLQMYTRDLPTSGNAKDEAAAKWNQDPVWFSREEARRWLPHDLEVGKVFELPKDLALRLATKHLIDMVKGQADTFNEDEIEELSISVHVVELSETHANIEIKGTTRAVASKTERAPERGVRTELLGSASFDRKLSRFDAFDLVCVGERWGFTRFNGRRRQPEASPIGFVFRLADPSTPIIAPAFIHRYEADWVERPAR